MIDSLHDTLTAEAHAREQLEHDTRDISEKLEEIRWMYPRIGDTMLTISGYAMDLTGISGSSEPPLPGGDALAMLGPWSPGYDEPDDLPHPGQIVREWADRWRQATRAPDPIGAKWATHLAVLRSNTEWFIRQDRNGHFRKDIRAIHGRLESLTGNSERPAPAPNPTPEEVLAALREKPEHLLTRKELGTILGIPPSTITTWRSRGLAADEKGRYRAGDILERLAA